MKLCMDPPTNEAASGHPTGAGGEAVPHGDRCPRPRPPSPLGGAQRPVPAVTPTSGYLFGQPGIKYQGTARGTLKVVVAGIF